MSETRVAVLGCGLMGAALIRTLAHAGRSVTAWNRTTDKAQALAAVNGRIAVAQSPVEAVESSQVVVLIVADYQAAGEVLDSLGEGPIVEKTIINLISGTPAQATAFETRVAAVGGLYLDGSIAAYPSDIGGADTLIAYSGEAAAWESAGSAVAALAGRSNYLGERASFANAFEAVIGSFYDVALGGFLEATAYASAHGLEPAALTEEVDYLIDLLRASVHEATEAIMRGDFSTDQATVSVFLDAVRSYRDGIVSSGHRGTLISALAANLEHAQARGHGEDGFVAQYVTERTAEA